jgi:uncharacterized membrane protein
LQSIALPRKVHVMQTSIEAEENLRVIRSLMEKATIYRAVSAPGALVGGVVSLGAGVVGFGVSQSYDAVRYFFEVWASVLIFTVAVNLVLLQRDAARRNEPFFSSGMKLAIRAMIPSLIAGGLCSLFVGVGGCALIASLWVLLYGVSLLAASHFAPTAIRLLGRAFFVSGAGLLIVGGTCFNWWHSPDETAAHLIMGATFGLFHLIYAACTWPRKTGGVA